MIELANPSWLIGLLGIPIVWWLHRFHQPDQPNIVSALFLWQDARVDDRAGSNITRPERYWWLRALSVGLLVIALAGPHWLTSGARPIHIWFDDSLSMEAREQDGQRYSLAIDTLIDALQQQGNVIVTIHFLTRPGESVLLRTADQKNWRTLLEQGFAGRSEARVIKLPSPALMPSAVEHWLVTDGADERLSDWLKNAPISRIIRSGQETENLAITGLSLRPSLSRSGFFNGLVTIANPGHHDAQVNVELAQDGQFFAQHSIHVAPGQTAQTYFLLDHLPDRELEARIITTDALTSDNRITLNITPLGPVATRIHGGCGPHVRAALTAHPAVQLVDDDATATLGISCGEENTHDEIPLLWLHHSAAYHPVTAIPRWQSITTDKRPDLSLQQDWLRTSGDADEIPGRPLLAADRIVLASVRERPRHTVDVFMDMENTALVRQPVYPLLLYRLIDIALSQTGEHSLLDPITMSVRRPDESRIAPGALPQVTVKADPIMTAAYRDLSAWIILIATAVILLDWGLRRISMQDTLTHKAAD